MQNQLTPNDYIVQRAHAWRTTEQALIAAKGDEKMLAQSVHHDAKRQLRDAIALAYRAEP